MPPSERQLLDLIAQRSAWLRLSGADLLVGPGDDCAVVSLGGMTLLVTVDQLIVGRHCTAETPTDLIARKAVARSVSDVAAMAGEPMWATATGLLPAGYAHGDALFGAMQRWAERWGCPLIGGDLATGPGPMVLTVTVTGRMPAGGAPILRSGARAGQGVWLSGPIGGSLASGRHLTFEPRLDAGRAARAAGATALIDLSDGLGIDADRVARASGVRLELDAALVPRHPDAGPWREAFAAGEDYELLACSDGPIPGFMRIGLVREGPPGAAVLDGDAEHPAERLGWDHGATD
jgi:thiamine-monophosphate kinase